MCESKLDQEKVIFNKCQVNGCMEEANVYHMTCKHDMEYIGFKRTSYIKFADRNLCEKHYDQYAMRDFKDLFYKTEVIEIIKEA